MVTCFEALARGIGERDFNATRIATCTAEEMALHLVIDAAEGSMRDGTLVTDPSLAAGEPRTVTTTSTHSGHSSSATEVLPLVDVSL